MVAKGRIGKSAVVRQLGVSADVGAKVQATRTHARNRHLPAQLQLTDDLDNQVQRSDLLLGRERSDCLEQHLRAPAPCRVLPARLGASEAARCCSVIDWASPGEQCHLLQSPHRLACGGRCNPQPIGNTAETDAAFRVPRWPRRRQEPASGSGSEHVARQRPADRARLQGRYSQGLASIDAASQGSATCSLRRASSTRRVGARH